jgi:hypothetical protein
LVDPEALIQRSLMNRTGWLKAIRFAFSDWGLSFSNNTMKTSLQLCINVQY